MEYYSAIKNNEIMPFAATWMDPEINLLSKSERERQISYDITYMRNLKKNDTNELTEQKQRGFPGGSVVKNAPANAGDTGWSPGVGRSHMPQSS